MADKNLSPSMGMQKQATLQMAIAMTIFGTIGIFVRYIPLPSSIIALARGIIGTLFILLFSLLQKKKPDVTAIRKNLVLLAVSGLFIGANWILLFEAYRYTTVATATLCYYLEPIFVFLLTPFVLKEKLTGKQIFCVLAALLGIVFLSGILQGEGIGAKDLKGILLGTSAALLYACVILMNKFLKDISSFDRTLTQIGMAAITILPYCLVTESVSTLTFGGTTILLLLVVGILNTGISYTLYFAAMKDLSASTTALFSYIDPVVAIILSTVILRETMGLYDCVGAVLILGSTLYYEFGDKISFAKK